MTQSLLRTRPPTRYSLRDLLLATALVAVYLTALTGLRRGLTGYDVKAYWLGVALGLVCGVGLWRRSRRSLKELGALRLRLSAQIDWWGLFLSQSFLLATFLVVLYTMIVPWESESHSIVLGLSCGTTISAFYALFALTRPQMELRDKGVAVGMWAVMPWYKVRLRRWERETTGRLELGTPFIRAVANVPQELRDEVDALLGEKVRSFPNVRS